MTPTKELEIPVGFAGLSRMVSDVDTLLAAARHQATAFAPGQPPTPSTPPIPSRTAPTETRPLTATSPSGSWYGWAVGALALFVFATMLFSEPAKQTVSVAPSSSPKTPAGSAPRTVSPAVPEELRQPFTEDKPPVGQSQVLTRTQIQYCLAENIRLEAEQSLVHDTDNFRAVRQFNDLIDDYNSRCADFRYHRSAMEAAKEAVERQRLTIEAEGVRRFTNGVIQSFPPSSSPRANEGTTKKSRVEKVNPEEEREVQEPSIGKESDQGGTQGSSAVEESDPVAPSATVTPLRLDEPDTEPGNPEAARNLEQCLDGRYPALCQHGLLTTAQAEQVAAAERAANLKQCLTGEYPFLCDHTRLTTTQAHAVEDAERRVMFGVCLEGRYPALCQEALLTPDQRQAIHTARASARQGASRN